MIESLVGNATAEKVLLYLQNYEKAYGSELSKTFNISISQVQKQLDRLEQGSLLVSGKVGRTRVYQWNPRNPVCKPIRKMLAEILDLLPESEIKKYYRKRQRPRRKGKPI